MNPEIAVQSQGPTSIVFASDYLNKISGEKIERECRRQIDGASARHAADVDTAWEKMRAAGVLPATSESTLLELIGTAAAPEFKALQRLIR
jgi:hypothetical protein